MLYEYVFSAPAYLRLMPSTFEKNNEEEYAILAAAVKEGIKQLRDDVAKKNVKMSILFNAYTEAAFDEWLRKWDIFGFESLYVDSGGLQVVTTGKQADETLKREVYTVQQNSDFAMCFDEIPCGNKMIEKELNTKSNRSRTDNKLYFPDRAEACARKTARNIREQIETLADLGSNTKVMYIIQGNNSNDMVEWFRYGVQELDAWHWDHIGGVALADTCIGNGPQESVEMLHAYHRIRREFTNEYTKDHIHLLGVGSVRRLLPIIQFEKGGFLPSNLRVSFDSTTFSMSYVMGRYHFEDERIDYNGLEPISGEMPDQPSKGGRVKSDKMWAGIVFRAVMNYFDALYTHHFPGVNRDEVLVHLLDSNRSVADTINNAGKHFSTMVRTNIPLLNCYQILLFADQIHRALTSNYDISRLRPQERNAFLGLAGVRDLRDYDDWARSNHKWLGMTRTRITRSGETAFTIDTQFD